MRNPGYYGIYAFQAGLGLPDREYYFTDDEKSEDIRAKYVAHIETMFDLAGMPGGADAAQTIMALETRLAEQNMKKEDTRDWAGQLQQGRRRRAHQHNAAVQLGRVTGELGVAELDGLIVIMTDYMKALDGIVQDTDIDTWKTYLNWVALNTAARQTLTKPWTNRTSSSTARP